MPTRFGTQSLDSQEKPLLGRPTELGDNLSEGSRLKSGISGKCQKKSTQKEEWPLKRSKQPEERTKAFIITYTGHVWGSRLWAADTLIPRGIKTFYRPRGCPSALWIDNSLPLDEERGRTRVKKKGKRKPSERFSRQIATIFTLTPSRCAIISLADIKHTRQRNSIASHPPWLSPNSRTNSSRYHILNYTTWHFVQRD